MGCSSSKKRTSVTLSHQSVPSLAWAPLEASHDQAPPSRVLHVCESRAVPLALTYGDDCSPTQKVLLVPSTRTPHATRFTGAVRVDDHPVVARPSAAVSFVARRRVVGEVRTLQSGAPIPT